MKIDIPVKNDRANILIYDKKKNKIMFKVILIEINITNLELLTQIENEQFKNYDFLVNEFFIIYKYKVLYFIIYCYISNQY